MPARGWASTADRGSQLYDVLTAKLAGGGGDPDRLPGLSSFRRRADLSGAEVELVDAERREYRLPEALAAAPRATTTC